MYFNKSIEGKYISMRCVREEDAAFIVRLRNDENKNQYVNPVSEDISLQVQWIRKQISRDNDYYFIFSDKSSSSLGLCSVYDINPDDHTAAFGRWISWGNALQNVESAVLSFDFAFENGIQKLFLDIVRENKKVINFWKRFGAAFDKEFSANGFTLCRYIITYDEYYSGLRDKNISLLRINERNDRK